MSLTTANLSGINAMLKEAWVTESMRDAFNSETILLSRLEREEAMVAGDQYIYSIRKSRNFGTGPRAESGVLPPVGSQGRAQLSLARTHYYGRGKMTGAAIDAAVRNGTIMNLVQDETSSAKSDLRKAFNRDLYGTGNGAITTVTTGASSATQTVGNTSWLEPGQTIVFATSTGTYATSAVVSSITNQTTVVLTGSLDTSSNSRLYVFPAGTTPGETDNTSTCLALAYNVAVGGLGLIYSTSNWGGLTARSTTDSWSVPTINSGAGGLTLDLMEQTAQDMRTAGNGDLSIIITDKKQYRAYGNLIAPDRRWVGTQQKLDGRFTSLDFGGVPVVWDPDCPPGVMYFLDEATWRLLIETDLGFVNRDGLTLRSTAVGTSGTDEYEFALLYRAQLACLNPKANALINSLPTT